MATTNRLGSIDLMRGFVIALMALDHVRDFFGPTPFGTEDLAQTTPAWFWTRWITHLCATTFVLLAGSSAFLRGSKTGIADLSRYLATRGAVLVLLEATWVSFSWQFGFDTVVLQVIWAIGMGMLTLSLLVWLPRPVIAAVAALLILPHNALDGIKSGNPLWMAWHQGGYLPLDQVHGIAFMYPLMPWLGLMAAGYAIGPLFHWDAARRQRFLCLAGALLMLLFVVLRSGNVYGDPDPWSAQGKGWMFDLMSFVRVHKYPPSLLYLCVTLGVTLPLLALCERVRASVPLLSLFGRTPMFFYLVHVALIHLLGGLYMVARYGEQPQGSPRGFTFPPGYEASLPVVYAAWLAILLLMYGLTLLWCRWTSPSRSTGAAAVAS
jgi:uncharacterized membrane protein